VQAIDDYPHLCGGEGLAAIGQSAVGLVSLKKIGGKTD
jgi:hypothetical protein